MEIHPLSAMYPMLSDEELADLAADIKQNGQLHPIVCMIDGETIVDGRNRYAACQLADVEPWFENRIEDEDQVKALIGSANLQRRDLTKGQKAMGWAILYPEPTTAKGGRGKKDETTKLEETSNFSAKRLQQARAVLRHSEEMARSVLSGGLSLDAALAEMTKRARVDAEPEVRIAALRNRYPDLAQKVVDEELSLEAAEVEAEVRDRQEAERRETMVRLTDYALRGVTSWASPEFVNGVVQRMADPEFQAQFALRVHADREQLDSIIEGAEQLLKFLRGM